ncbi:hypothetical protein TNCV_4395851 [Trichonephila clavipes]|uniref:Uncharacterized protein n=1 Tax=Trichonephila clavipes TaxID=2585209 RepID=A0A8X6W5I7_TRICX|nr:hypothetical protein TNCV_4395851 [Trichonephila clavipes]
MEHESLPLHGGSLVVPGSETTSSRPLGYRNHSMCLRLLLAKKHGMLARTGVVPEGFCVLKEEVCLTPESVAREGDGLLLFLFSAKLCWGEETEYLRRETEGIQIHQAWSGTVSPGDISHKETRFERTENGTVCYSENDGGGETKLLNSRGSEGTTNGGPTRWERVRAEPQLCFSLSLQTRELDC